MICDITLERGYADSIGCGNGIYTNWEILQTIKNVRYTRRIESLVDNEYIKSTFRYDLLSLLYNKNDVLDYHGRVIIDEYDRYRIWVAKTYIIEYKYENINLCDNTLQEFTMDAQYSSARCIYPVNITSPRCRTTRFSLILGLDSMELYKLKRIHLEKSFKQQSSEY